MDTPDIDKHVGKQLRLRRTALGYTQKALAKAVGITFQQVQKYEKGSNAMNATRLYEFAQFMRVPVEFFYDGLERGAISSSAGSVGFAEEKVTFEHGQKAVSERESLELVKAFKRIKEPSIRKRLADMVRAIADNRTVVE